MTGAQSHIVSATEAVTWLERNWSQLVPSERPALVHLVYNQAVVEHEGHTTDPIFGRIEALKKETGNG